MPTKSKILLTHKTDKQLIYAVKRYGSSDAFLEVCRRYEALFYKICQKYSPALSASGVFVQDIFNEKDIIILHCIKSFDSKRKVKLSSWIGNYARYLCLNSINSRRFTAPSSDDEIKARIEERQAFHDYSDHKNELSESRDYIFDLLSQLKDTRIKEIFEYRYFGDKKMIWGNIAKKINASPQTVISLHKKGLTLIKNKMINNSNICDFV